MGEKKRREKAAGSMQREMPVLEGFPDRIIDQIVEEANETMIQAQALGRATANWVVEQLNAAQVIICTYPDEDWNWSVAVARGIRDILPVINGHPDAPRAFYLRCWNRLDAEGYWTGFGDGRTKPGTPTVADIPPQDIRLVNGIPVEDRHAALVAAKEDKEAAVDAGLDHGAGREAWVREAFDADIVWGVWENRSSEGGVGIAMLKGNRLLERLRIDEGTTVARQTHILCANVGHADMLYRGMGEGRAPGSDQPTGQGGLRDLPVRVTRYAVELKPVLHPDGRGGHLVAMATSIPRRMNDDARGGRRG